MVDSVTPKQDWQMVMLMRNEWESLEATKTDVKVVCRVKVNMTWPTNNMVSSHYFSKKNKASTLQEHER